MSCSTRSSGGAPPDVHTVGLQLWGGLAAVMIAWTGLRIAFSGTFDAWTMVRLVIGIAIPRTLLHHYVVPIPGVGMTFPAMMAGGGIWLQNLFLADVVSAGYSETASLVQAYSAHLSAARSSGNLLSIVTAGVTVLFSSLVSVVMGASLVVALLLLFCVTYAQVIWPRSRWPSSSCSVRSSSRSSSSSRSGREYAEIWGETVRANRKLRTILIFLSASIVLGVFVLLRIAGAEPPKPIVLRVDEIGRAEALAYEAATA